MGEHMVSSLFNASSVENGFASIRDVENHLLEDRMPSFFLAETCKSSTVALFVHSFA
jgi:hypothetical protein